MGKEIGNIASGRNSGIQAGGDIVAHQLGGFFFGKAFFRGQIENPPRQAALFEIFCLTVFIQIGAQLNQIFKGLFAAGIMPIHQIKGRGRPFQHILAPAIIQPDQINHNRIGQYLGKF